MLTEHERAEIDAEIAHYPIRESVAIDALKIVQKHRGWIADDALIDLADYLGMSRADLDGIATFYNLLFRKPVGRHVIFVCDSVSCWIMGFDRIREALLARLGVNLGETTPDGRFTVLPTVCLGACDHAPVLMIDRDTHGDLDPAALAALLERYP
ncbi:MAG: NADH-quinone oxidoreductase subunit NuoE [Acidobacteriota bacterium]